MTRMCVALIYLSPLSLELTRLPQWGNAMTIVPLRLYQYYGDIDILKLKHQFMVEYVEYLVNRAGGKPYLDDGGLGDWEAIG